MKCNDIVMKKLLSTMILVSLTLSSTACLRTRANLKDEKSSEREEPKAVSVQPAQEVQPQAEYIVDQMKTEITQLTGRVEDLERALKEQNARGGNEEIKKLEERLAQLEQHQVKLTETLGKVQESVALKNPSDLFNQAKAEYDKEHYESAADTFGTYLKIPKVAKADEATFLRGESYFKIKQYKKAIVEFSKFPEKYTRSNRAPEALFKIGLSFEALGMNEDAKGFYQELVEKYPKSQEAKKARNKVK
jgi:tol-pal system protein YbgF